MPRTTTIYRKDYLWPESEKHFDRNTTCCEIAAPKPDCQGSQQAEVMVRKCPEGEHLEYNETDACLKKLFRRHPELLASMRKKPTFNALKKFNCDRFTSTYQCDYGHKANEPVDFDGLPRKRVPCPLDGEEEGEDIPDCRPSTKSRRALMKLRMGLNAYDEPCKIKHRTRKKPEVPLYMKNKFNPWVTEYRDTTAKTGNTIIKLLNMSNRDKKKLSRIENLRI